MNIIYMNSQEASKYLSNKDNFINSLSPFDRSARLKTSEDVSKEKFIQFVAKQSLEWKKFEMEKLNHIFKMIEDKFGDYYLNFPENTYFIKTTGNEEGKAAYCRRNAIIVPEPMIENVQLIRIIIHELFHIFSRNNLDKRELLYNIIGFHKCPELSFPNELKMHKITNPDAYKNNFYITISIKGSEIDLIPIIYSTEDYNLEKGGEFFNYLQFKLLGVDIKEDSCFPLYDNKELVLVDPRNLNELFDKIGRNTNYIIHPEEILADNFVILINNEKNIMYDKILQEMSAILREG